MSTNSTPALSSSCHFSRSSPPRTRRALYVFLSHGLRRFAYGSAISHPVTFTCRHSYDCARWWTAPCLSKYCSMWIVLMLIVAKVLCSKQTLNSYIYRNPVFIGFKEMRSSDLVPGDVIEIPRGGMSPVPCDAVVLTGNILVDEAILTGESAPATKTPIPPSSGRLSSNSESDDSELHFTSATSTNQKAESHDLDFSMRTHARHVLFAGTRVLQTRYLAQKHVLAVVVRTGTRAHRENHCYLLSNSSTSFTWKSHVNFYLFSICTGFQTAKGDLLRAIMYPRPVDFKFTRQCCQFLIALAIMSFVGFIYTIVLMV